MGRDGCGGRRCVGSLHAAPAAGKGNPKTDAQIIEGAQNAGGDDMPWDKIMEFYREKKTGDPEKAAKLLREIDAIVNRTK